MAVKIGIACRYNRNRDWLWLPQAYANAVAAAGGLPLVIPLLPRVLDQKLLAELDGLVLTGGEDVNPCYYGEEPEAGLDEVNEHRDQQELALARIALQKGLPILGICRGMQLLNVVAGGTLIQDLPVIGPIHTAANEVLPRHVINILPGSLLAEMLQGTSMEVNSNHHQAVKEMAPTFRAVAWAEDGIIEAMEGRAVPVLGVQWHPERMYAEEPLFLNLFSWLVNSGGQKR
ncbi:MAG: gamma-glutamyl-gamma-aminobutyrate hydrolase family protein [bacterium]|jgi:putative glutamine amidotransferase